MPICYYVAVTIITFGRLKVTVSSKCKDKHHARSPQSPSPIFILGIMRRSGKNFLHHGAKLKDTNVEAAIVATTTYSAQ
ncbi:hypothetical protein [Microseira wollei]|uniref:Uncharacterized protein n=1 Tax=Microseira wollei NIES-4236 TaxID=2530354 RepID=A0AAV3X8P5_9CYAN|nr:hypothetical protein [Microseira wollei]GET38210.1 hypothetical protein MiSe_29640 [Microseira wollei NIES-4236]